MKKSKKSLDNRMEIGIAVQYLYGFENHLMSVNTDDPRVLKKIQKLSEKLDKWLDKLNEIKDLL